MRNLKQIFIIILAFVCYSCNDFESNIKSHFKKFILVGKYKEYKVESITKTDTLTVKKDELQKITNNINNLKNKIQEYRNGILINKRVIKEINEATVITKSAIVNGEQFTYKVYRRSNTFSSPSYNNGKEADINHEKEIIDFHKENILNASTKIADEKSKIPSIENENNSKILLISSEVIISGYNAYGEDKYRYKVKQDPQGKIKKVIKK